MEQILGKKVQNLHVHAAKSATFGSCLYSHKKQPISLVGYQVTTMSLICLKILSVFGVGFNTRLGLSLMSNDGGATIQISALLVSERSGMDDEFCRRPSRCSSGCCIGGGGSDPLIS